MLYLIIGRNPLPNLIAASTRVKVNGKITCIITGGEDGTESIYTNLKKVIEEKNKGINLNYVTVSTSDWDNDQKRLREEFEKSINDREVFELNFTGGTKVMSSSACYIFKEVCEEKGADGILSYIDGEKEMIFNESTLKSKWNYKHEDLKKLDETFHITLNDIVNVHMGNEHIEYNEKPYDELLGEKIFNYFVDCDSDKWRKGIDFLEQFYFDDYKKLVEKVEHKNDDKRDSKTIEIINKMKENGTAFDKKLNIFEDVSDIDDLAIKNKKINFRFIEAIRGKWFEDYIFKIMLELKSENVIEDVANSFQLFKKNKNGNKGDTHFEVDLVAYRKYRLFSISITSQEKECDAKKKLYEIKLRGKQLGGEENKIVFISLCPESQPLVDECRNVWDGDELKNILIIGVDKFKNIKNELKDFILGVNEHNGK